MNVLRAVPVANGWLTLLLTLLFTSMVSRKNSRWQIYCHMHSGCRGVAVVGSGLTPLTIRIFLVYAISPRTFVVVGAYPLMGSCCKAFTCQELVCENAQQRTIRHG